MDQGRKSFAGRRSLSKRLSSQKYVGKLKGTLKRFLSDRHGRIKEQESSISSNSNADAMDVSTPGIENTSSSSSSSGSQDASLGGTMKKRKSEIFTDSFSKKTKVQQNERKVDDSSDSSTRSKNKRTSDADADISLERGEVPASPSRRRFGLTKYLSSGRDRTNSITTSKRNRLQLLLRQYHQRGSSKLEEMPSFLDFEGRPSVDSENEFIGRYSNFSNISESPADLAHAVNLYYRGKDTSPVGLVDSLRDSGNLVSQLSGISFRSILSQVDSKELADKLPDASQSGDVHPHDAQASGQQLDRKSGRLASQLSGLSFGSFSRLSQADLKDLANKLPDASQSRDVHPQDATGVWTCQKCGWTCRQSDSNVEEQRRHEEHCDDIMKVQQWLGRQESIGEGRPDAPEQDVCEDHQYALETHDSTQSSADVNALDDSYLQKVLKITDEHLSQRDDDHARQARGSFDYHEVPNHTRSLEIQTKESMDPDREDWDNASKTKLNGRSTDHQAVESHPDAEIAPNQLNDHNETVGPDDSNVIHESSTNVSGFAEETSSASSDTNQSKHFVESEGLTPHPLGSPCHSWKVEERDKGCHEDQRLQEQRLELEKQVSDVGVQTAEPLNRIPDTELKGNHSAETDSNEGLSSDSDGGASQQSQTPMSSFRSEDTVKSNHKLHEASSHVPYRANMTPEAMGQHGVAPVCDELKQDGAKIHADKKENVMVVDGEGVQGRMCVEVKTNESGSLNADKNESLMAADEDGVVGKVRNETKSNGSIRGRNDSDENFMTEDAEDVKAETEKYTSLKCEDSAKRGTSFTDESREQDHLETSEWSYSTTFDLSEEDLRQTSRQGSSDADHGRDQTDEEVCKEGIEECEAPTIQSHYYGRDGTDGRVCKDVAEESEAPMVESKHSNQRDHADVDRMNDSFPDGSSLLETKSDGESADFAFDDRKHDLEEVQELPKSLTPSQSWPKRWDPERGPAFTSHIQDVRQDGNDPVDCHSNLPTVRTLQARTASLSAISGHGKLGEDRIRTASSLDSMSSAFQDDLTARKASTAVPHDSTERSEFGDIREGSASESFLHQSEDDTAVPQYSTQRTGSEDIREGSASESSIHQSEDDTVRDPHDTTQSTRREDVSVGSATESFARQPEGNAATGDRDTGLCNCLPDLSIDFSWARPFHANASSQVTESNGNGMEQQFLAAERDPVAQSRKEEDLGGHGTSRGMGFGSEADEFGEIREVHEISPAESKENDSKNCLSLLLEAISTWFLDDTKEEQGLRKSLLPNVETSRSGT